jgi:hypothetical protein
MARKFISLAHLWTGRRDSGQKLPAKKMDAILKMFDLMVSNRGLVPMSLAVRYKDRTRGGKPPHIAY